VSLFARVTPHRLRQLWYLPLLALAMGLMLLRLLLMARLLDVPGFAAFSAGVLVSTTFGMLACLGLQPMLLRDLSIQIVKRRQRPGLVLLAQCVLVASACAVAGLIAALTGLAAAGLPSSLFAVAVLHGFTQQVFLVATIESRSRGLPVRFAWQNLIRSLAVLGVGGSVAMLTGAAFWVLTVEALVTLALAQWTLQRIFRAARLPATLVYRLALRRLPRLNWRSAGALMSVTIVSFMLINADRWLAAEVLSVNQFAQYGFVWMVLMVAQSVQAVINAVVFPMLARRFGANGRRAAFDLSARASCAALVSGALAAVPLALALDAVVARWFAEYRSAMQLLPWLLAVAVLRVADFWTSYLMVVGLEARLLRLMLFSGLASVIAWLAFVRPWSGSALELADVAALALLLAATSFAAAALASWRVAARQAA
jgi:O-antigen/teichoic acid export membrane protein